MFPSWPKSQVSPRTIRTREELHANLEPIRICEVFHANIEIEEMLGHMFPSWLKSRFDVLAFQYKYWFGFTYKSFTGNSIAKELVKCLLRSVPVFANEEIQEMRFLLVRGELMKNSTQSKKAKKLWVICSLAAQRAKFLHVRSELAKNYTQA